MGTDISKHDLDKISDALSDLMAHTEENEPDAVNYIAAIETVLAGLPENEE